MRSPSRVHILKQNCDYVICLTRHVRRLQKSRRSTAHRPRQLLDRDGAKHCPLSPGTAAPVARAPLRRTPPPTRPSCSPPSARGFSFRGSPCRCSSREASPVQTAPPTPTAKALRRRREASDGHLLFGRRAGDEVRTEFQNRRVAVCGSRGAERPTLVHREGRQTPALDVNLRHSIIATRTHDRDVGH